MTQIQNDFAKAKLAQKSIVILSEAFDGMVARIEGVRADADAGFVYTLRRIAGKTFEVTEAALCGPKDQRIGTAYNEYNKTLTEKQVKQMQALARIPALAA